MADETTTTTTDDDDTDFTDASEIIEETAELINTFRDSFTQHMINALDYANNYDAYNLVYVYDSDVLKEKMKAAVIESIPNDIC